MTAHEGFRLSVALNGAGSHPAAPARPFTPEAYASLVRGAEEDGFRLRPAVLPVTADLVPVLQRRGLFRTEYTALTLRGHLGPAGV
ncbi:hypothetical protein [Streptomyces sp. NBC_00887]|uniref:hypothetical protein n=1 Tax=Streptomyces sp. NBC_00887 TaxID=2975859 RepID=UPI00386A3C8B